MVCDIASRPFDEWSKDELKRIARALNVKMSTARGSPRTKRGLWQAIKAARSGHGAVRHQCLHARTRTGYCAKPGTHAGRVVKCPRSRSRSRSPRKRLPRARSPRKALPRARLPRARLPMAIEAPEVALEFARKAVNAGVPVEHLQAANSAGIPMEHIANAVDLGVPPDQAVPAVMEAAAPSALSEGPSDQGFTDLGPSLAPAESAPLPQPYRDMLAGNSKLTGNRLMGNTGSRT